MKTKNVLFVLLLLVTKLSSQVSFGTAEKINSDWRFALGDYKNAELKDCDISRWEVISLQHDWSVKGQLNSMHSSCTGFLPGGIGWYRKSLEIPLDKTNEKVYIYFEGIYNRSEVFVNGISVGKRPNGYVSFMYDITPFVEFGKANDIAVRVDHSQSADSRWYTGSGIYRDVWVVYSNPIHIEQWGVFAYPKKVTSRQATLYVEVEVKNDTKEQGNIRINNELFSDDGKLVAKKSKALAIETGKTNKSIVELNVLNPQLWSLDNPSLYKLKTTVYQNGKVIDETITTTGFRTYTFDANKGFALNGVWQKVKGVCLHHDAGVLGSAVPREVWRRRLETLKEVGCNAIRTSHNPQATDLYELCDEIGLLVMNEAFDEWEFPKRKWIQGWNVGTPGFQGSFDFFDEWGEKDLADMVRRDRNHISIFSWSIGNEVDYPNDPYSHPVLDGGAETGFTQPVFGGYKSDAPDAMRLGDIAKRLAAVVRKYDTSRPVTAGLAGVAMSNETEYPKALDIVGYNYTEDRYKSDHEQYPKRVIYGSENRHDYNAWRAVLDNEHIFGQFLWTGIDYLGESGSWPSRGFYSGLLDFGGFIKPRGYFRQALWSNKPVAYIGTYALNSGAINKDVWSALEAQNGHNDNIVSMDAWPRWNYNDGQLIRVVCYTNAHKAQLKLNGKVVGKTLVQNNTSGIIYWDIPYQEGKLEVVGLDENGMQVSNYEIVSSGAPYAIKVKQIWNDKSSSLVQILVQIVDEKGVEVMISDNEITCNIAGDAKLLGLEASNNSDMGDYTDNVQRAFNGSLLAYIKKDKNDSPLVVRFSSPWLQSVEIEIK